MWVIKEVHTQTGPTFHEGARGRVVFWVGYLAGGIANVDGVQYQEFVPYREFSDHVDAEMYCNYLNGGSGLPAKNFH